MRVRIVRVRHAAHFWRSVAAVGIALLCYSFTQSPSQSSAPDSTPPQLVIQTGHSSRINCAVFGPDRRWLASGGADNTIRLWDVESGHELRALTGHRNWIKSLAVSRKGDRLASGSNDHTIKVWNVVSGRELLTLSGHEGPVEAVAFSPDDRWIISASADNTIRVWDADSGRHLQTLKGQIAGITALEISADGRTLASGNADNGIKLWDTTTWHELRTFNKQTRKITTLAFSGSGRYLASGSMDGSLILWDTTNGRDRMLSRPGASAVLASAFIAGGELLSARADGAITSWDTTGQEKRVVAGTRGMEEILFASFSRDGELLASTSGNRVVEIQTARDGKLMHTLASHSASFFSLAFSHDGRWLAAGTNDRTIRRWQVATGREMPKLSGHTGWVKAVAFSPDSHLLASGSNSGELKLWDVNTGREVHSERYSQERLHAIAFSPDGKLVAAAGTGQVVRLLDVATKQSRSLTEHTGEITSLAFLPKSSLIASGSTDKTIRLSNLATGALVRTYQLSEQVNAIAANSDGTILAAGTADNRVVLLTVSSGEMHTMSDHTGEVFSLAFSPDGNWLASGSMDQTARLWDARTGTPVRTLAASSGDVNGVVFSNDSQSLLTANGDGSMIVWNAESGKQAGVMVSIPESNDWLLATPGGLFDGSRSAWKLLLWRFGENTFKVAPVESFFNEFYYPGLLADVLLHKDPKAKQDILKRDRRQPQISLGTADENPSFGTSNRTVRLKLGVTEAAADPEYKAGSGVQDLRLFRNGLLVRSWSGDVLRGASGRTIETSVTIVAGKNDFAAYAFNRDNVKSADSLLSITGAESLRREGTAYLVVVGVSKYANSQYNLNYSAADAIEIGAQLKGQQELLGRYNPIEVISLLNDQATKENILLALKLLAGTVANPLPKDAPADLLKIKPAQPEDAVIFYFSGHGTAQEDRFYLIPHDVGYAGLRSELDQAGLATILSHSVSDIELEEALQPVDADQLLLVIDACNSGQVLHSADERRGPMNTRGLAQLAYEKGMYVLTASQSDEVAFESAGLKHSYLAYALVEEGIKSGAADADHNGQVLLNEWFDYATDRVPRIGGEKSQTGKQLEEMDPDEKRVQRPRVFNMRDGGAERFIIARAGDKRAR
jgi:WD40 repeat protein